MNDHEKANRGNDDASGPDDEAVARLMALAGPRPEIPDDVRDRVRTTVHREWQASTRRTRTLRWAVPLALAATVVLAVVASWQPAPVAAPLAGTVARVNGPAGTGDIAVGRRLSVGDTLSTGTDQSVSVALVNGVSLRLASNTSLEIDDRYAYTLVSGSVYADSGAPVYQRDGIRISTPLGSVTDVGTQFAVDYDGDGLRVAVREGSVDVARDQQSWSADAGQLLRLRQDENAVYDEIAADDNSWDWAVAVAPLFEIDNRSLFDFLNWGARETGKDLRFANDDIRRTAMQTTLHGSVSDFSPEEATLAVLATTQFRYRVTDDAIVIDR